jgi:tetratricopeptide (TPR) repeat protein
LVGLWDGPGALAAYQAGLAIREGLAKRDPANTQWQRDLSVSNNKIGDVLVAQGDWPGALAAYQAALAIREDLANRDPANTVWQRDLSVSNNKIGDVLVAQGDGPGALAAYQAGLAIAEGLAKRDPANTGWQVDVAVSCSKLGSLDSLLLIQERQEYLSRGLNLLTKLKQAGRLHANQDCTGWFDSALRKLQ